MRSVLAIVPTTNYAYAASQSRRDQLRAFGHVLMGLGHPLQLVSSARSVDGFSDWAHPPLLERRWYAVVEAVDEAQRAARTRTLQESLEGVGLRCGASSVAGDPPPIVSPASVRSGGEWASTLVLRRWPREVAPGWLGNAMAGDLPVDLGIHIRPQDPQQIARWLRSQQTTHSQANAAKPDAGSELASGDAESVRRKLVARTDRPVRVAIAMTVRAPDLTSLRSRQEELAYDIGLALGDARPATFEQDRGLEATLPTGQCNLLGAWRTLDCTSVASTWPFQPATVNHTNGAPLGVTTRGGMLVKLDPFDESLNSFSGVVLAMVGAGKSYFLKLLARRLKGVEVLVVEHNDPPEYAGVPGVKSTPLTGNMAQRTAQLREFVTRLWETARADPRPRMLILDELWSLLRDEGLASLVEEIARMGRKYYLSLWIATQQIQELIESPYGMAVLNNAAIRVYLQQDGPDVELLAKKMRLSDDARQFLSGAARGQALLDVRRMLVPVNIQATKLEHALITTDPRERMAA